MILDFLYRWRFALAALLCLCGLGIAGLSFLPLPGRPLVVAARPIAIGETITSLDLRLETVPPALQVAGAWAEPKDLIGKKAGINISERTVLSPDLVSARSFAAAAPGDIVLPIELSDSGSLALAQLGARVQIWRTGSGEASLLVSQALVVDTSTKAPSMLGGTQNAIAFVALSPSDASEVLAAGTDNLVFAVRS